MKRETLRFVLPGLLLLAMACNDGVPPIDQATEDSAGPRTEQLDESATASVDSANINRPEMVKAEADGSFLLTAEKGKATGPMIKYMPEWRAFGWFTSEDKVEWDVHVPASGAYEVTLEWSVSDEEAGKEYIIEANGKKLSGKVKRSGSWETFEREKIGRIQLSPGQQKIVFRPAGKFEGALMDLRQLKMVPVN